MLKEIIALVFVVSTSTSDIEKISQDFVNMYSDRGNGVELSVYTSKSNDKQHVVMLESPQEFHLFNLLVNYISYPMNRNYRLNPYGYWKVEPNQHPSKEVPTELLMVFIPQEDREYDNVYAVSRSGEAMKLGFAYGEEYTSLKAENYKFIETSFDPSDYGKPLIIRNVPIFLRRAK
jgi:hypothetical protein